MKEELDSSVNIWLRPPPFDMPVSSMISFLVSPFHLVRFTIMRTFGYIA